jgi:hypothetical protein
MLRSAFTALAAALPLLIGVPVLANSIELGDGVVAALFVVAVTGPAVLGVHLEDRRRHQRPIAQR